MADKRHLTADMLRQLLIYDPTTGRLRWRERRPVHFKHGKQCHSWNAAYAGNFCDTDISAYGYRLLHVFGKDYLSHRLIWKMVHGTEPVYQIDHINGDKTDNSIANLRDVTNTVNSRNVARKHLGPSGYAGVRERYPGRWQVTLCDKYIGTFDSLAEAAEAQTKARAAIGFTERHGTEPFKLSTQL